MSKELADRLEQWLKWTILNRQEKQLLNEAIAALRSKVVPEKVPDEWLQEMEWIAETYDDTKSTGALAAELYDVACTAKRLVNKYKVSLYAAPSRETATEVPVHSKSQYKRVAAQGGNPVLSRDTAKPEAAPALSAEQFSERDIEYWRRQLLSIEWSSPKTDHLHINTICNMALSSLTARDDGIEAAAKLADANGALQIRWFAEDIRKLKGASHD